MIKTSLLYWWPKVKDLGIPVPKTEILEVDNETLQGILEAPWPPGLVGQVCEAANEIGYPLFLRTDLASGKFAWRRTCYIPSAAMLLANARGVIEENEMAGVVGLDYRALVFREMLNLYAPFTAFRGDLPIGRERRYFIRDGEVECHHPYWIEDAVKQGKPRKERWQEILAKLNDEISSEIELLSGYSQRVGKVVDGYWSVDYAMDVDGTWWLIDMAEGEKSWHPDH